MERPIIGVLPLYDGDKESYWMLPGYMKAIEDAGGIPFMLPLTSDVEHITQIAHMFDGFLFTGGHDVNPELYGETVEEVCGELCNPRDVLEKALFQQVVKLDKPALGICRGLQLFNVLLGGTLYQDLPAQLRSEPKVRHKQAPPYAEPAHPVYIEQGNLLHRILKTETLKVNSCHHQGIKKLSEQLLPAAKAEDGLIEAVAMPDKRFILAVQWHPEFSYQSDRYNFRLFEEFVKSCVK
ncbi:gamma-glutamyl-gamma-aminobutyrate hydrolase family protein [Paenibacillus pinistramenti]|uniref:gamma-glutamyl-gamma-aminobutyrate hydrolase family protein n=1 Tax=Paenibacillus pinistramenti TaxID=1768003 RepID=UPI001107E2EF|nr:gamma-glutamyl-gamma-aminobutyrate hydrolase family protein [Paenibacillus pinistramenti]